MRVSSPLIKAFIVTFDNSRRRYPQVPYQQYEAVGVEFQDTKHVVIDTPYAPRADYHDLAEMEMELNKWGKCEIAWIGAESEVAV